MHREPSAEQLELAAAGLATAVGVGAAVSPTLLLRLFGVAPSEVTGAAALGWRLFALRNLFVGIAGLRGDARARGLILPVQLADQVVFQHAYRTRSVPRRASGGAIAVSGVLIALCTLARRAPVRPAGA